MRDAKLHSKRYWAFVFALLVAAFTSAILAWSLVSPSSGHATEPKTPKYVLRWAKCIGATNLVGYQHWMYWSPGGQQWKQTAWYCTPKGSYAWIWVRTF